MGHQLDYVTIALGLVFIAGCGSSDSATSETPTDIPAAPQQLSFEAVAGTWEATIEDPFVGELRIEVILQTGAFPNQSVGSYVYAFEGTECGGSLNAVEAQGLEYVVRETMTFGQDVCAEGSNGLTYEPTVDELAYQHFNSIGEPRSTARLTRK